MKQLQKVNMTPLDLFDNFFSELPFPSFPSMRGMQNVLQTDYFIENNEMCINVDVAGSTSDNVTVDIDKNRYCVTVRVAKQYERKENKPSFYIRERVISDQNRQFRLPDNIDFDSVTAVVKNGLLTIRGKLLVPEETGSRITIKVEGED